MISNILKLILIWILIQSNDVFSQDRIRKCFYQAGKRYSIDPLLLYSIAKYESNFKRQAININKNGTHDVGIMQVNSIWIPQLEKMGIRKRDLYEPCTNIFVGAWILSQAIQKSGRNWRSIGAYNVGHKRGEKRERLRKNYAQKIHDYYSHIRMQLSS